MEERLSVASILTSEVTDHFLFDRMVQRCEDRQVFPVAVCWPCSTVSLAGAMEAARAGIIRPVLIGPVRELTAIAASLGIHLGSYQLIPADSEEEAAERQSSFATPAMR